MNISEPPSPHPVFLCDFFASKKNPLIYHLKYGCLSHQWAILCHSAPPSFPRKVFQNTPCCPYALSFLINGHAPWYLEWSEKAIFLSRPSLLLYIPCVLCLCVPHITLVFQGFCVEGCGCSAYSFTVSVGDLNGPGENSVDANSRTVVKLKSFHYCPWVWY
jgi:hypothetical protein